MYRTGELFLLSRRLMKVAETISMGPNGRDPDERTPGDQ
jgi:hypothetical protein